MMERQLTVEFPIFQQNRGVGQYTTNLPTGYVAIRPNIFKYESTIDLGGYTRQDDLTVFFRRSFEQLGGYDLLEWSTYDPNRDAILENTIISSVPLTDLQLEASLLTQPGFTPYTTSAPSVFGNFNREHIIHGRFCVAYANSVIGAGSFAGAGTATLVNLVDNYYSSLEPTAADTLFCYRVIALPLVTSDVDSAIMPAKRVILDAYVDAEPNNEYMMRLKRSYELANQV